MDRSMTRREFMQMGVAAGTVFASSSLIGFNAFATGNKAALLQPKAATYGTLKIVNPQAPKPNIIIILTDDLGYGDPGCYGGKSIRTPNIDSLAREGAKFTDFYASNAVCSPSRAGLLTGRYPMRSGITSVLPPQKESFEKSLITFLAGLSSQLGMTDREGDAKVLGLPADEIILAKALRLAGYRTGMVGKWHLGDFSQDPKYNPTQHGFDEFFGLPHSNDMVPCALYRNMQEIEPDIGRNQARLTGLYTREAIRFMEQSKGKPFFLYFAHTFPHQPLFASERFKRKSKGGLYGDVVEEIDWSVGEILKCLREIGLEQNTLVIFTSDNGPWFEGSPGGLRGRKGQSYEGGFRVPGLFRWPGHIPAGRVCREPAINLDLFPTCLALAGLGLPMDRIIDGKDISGLLTGREEKTPHDTFFFYHLEELEGIRSGKWKYLRNINHYVYPRPIDNEDLLLGKIGKGLLGRWPLLYDMEYDPGESYNCIDTYPEIGRQLHQMMIKWEQDLKNNPRGWIKH